MSQKSDAIRGELVSCQKPLKVSEPGLGRNGLRRLGGRGNMNWRKVGGVAISQCAIRARVCSSGCNGQTWIGEVRPVVD